MENFEFFRVFAMRGILHRTFFILVFLVVGTSLIYLLVSGPPVHNLAISSVNISWSGVSHLINTPNCVIPYIDPFHPSLKKFIAEDPKTLSCSDKPPLTEESGVSLIYFEERIHFYGVSNASVQCFYNGIKRLEELGNYTKSCDEKWSIEKKIKINERVTPLLEDAILVKCIYTTPKGKGKSIYENVHFFIQSSRIEKKREKFKANFWERRRENLSVIIFGMDSVSRGNLHRHMPKTFAYLTDKLKAVDLKGYNKVGDNTDPNLSAILTGMHYEELKNHSCLVNNSIINFDDCPFIWDEFEGKGYATVFAEDGPWMGTFHWRKAGFCKEPTDYYNRPYFYAAEKTIGNSPGGKRHCNLCQGERVSISLVHNYSLAIAESLQDIPYFAYYWTAASTHDNLKEPAAVDQLCMDYLKLLSEGGYLENTVLFFISDHGLRWGDFRSTYSGMLEERLPFVMIKFPEWFEQEYPEAFQNLHVNTKRLTSNFDVHITLIDILNQAYGNLEERSFTPTLPNHGQSLFKEISENRTCSEAGIPDHYCACEDTKEVDPLDPYLLRAAGVCIEVINNGLETFPDCVPLKLGEVLSGRVGYARNSTLPKAINTIVSTYQITFTTVPGYAKLEATLTFHDGDFKLTSEVSRINRYGSQSHCISDDIYRKYCSCKDLIA
ncbi:uncharacterized protein [Palaemon carinicauda]|uniref:uncharacterized protein n=1 Tax=Palaemon carinicauda TaxID=392227 RepID=UPI0035B672A5